MYTKARPEPFWAPSCTYKVKGDASNEALYDGTGYHLPIPWSKQLALIAFSYGAEQRCEPSPTAKRWDWATGRAWGTLSRHELTHRREG